MKVLLQSSRVLVCGVVVMELLRGIRLKQQAAQVANVLEGLAYIEVSRDIWRDAGVLAAGLDRTGVVIPPSDLLIASLARGHDVALFTFDLHFDRVPGLKRHRERNKA